MVKVYIAADFGRVDEAEALGRLIERLDGLRVVSRWHQRPNVIESASSTRMGGPTGTDVARAAAHRNLDDICGCDLFLVLTTGTTARGGRHFETGYALAHNKPIIVVGPIEHAFQHLAEHVIGDETHLQDLLQGIVSMERAVE